MQVKQYFTVEDAERLLPKVRRLLSKMQRLKAQINFLAEEKEAPIELTEPFTEDEIYKFAFAQEIKMNKELHRHAYEFFKTMDQLNALGCELKDIDEGLVDFPFRLQDRDVELCWKDGENSIMHWHETGDGYHNRKPIIDLDDIL